MNKRKGKERKGIERMRSNKKWRKKKCDRNHSTDDVLVHCTVQCTLLSLCRIIKNSNIEQEPGLVVIVKLWKRKTLKTSNSCYMCSWVKVRAAVTITTAGKIYTSIFKTIYPMPINAQEWVEKIHYTYWCRTNRSGNNENL